MDRTRAQMVVVALVQWRQKLLLLQATLAPGLAVGAVWWLIWSQDAGSPWQWTLQILVPVAIGIGLAATGTSLHAGPSWWPAFTAYVLALPSILPLWRDPVGAPGDESCGASGFVPSAMADTIAWASGPLALLGAGVAVVGGLLALRPAMRPMAWWLLLAGVTQLAAGIASMTCIGT